MFHPLRGVCTGVLLLGLASTASAGTVSLVLERYSGGDSGLAAQLAGTGLFDSVAWLDADVGVPTLASLAVYDSVLFSIDAADLTDTALPDVLADYVDAGGHVVLGTFVLSGYSPGRITTSAYSPLVSGGSQGAPSGLLDIVAPTDPVFDGVTEAGFGAYFVHSRFAVAALVPGATLLATDGSTRPMVARNAAGNVIAINLFPHGGYVSSSEQVRLFANALQPTAVPLPSAAWLGISLLGGVGLIRVRRRPVAAR